MGRKEDKGQFPQVKQAEAARWGRQLFLEQDSAHVFRCTSLGRRSIALPSFSERFMTQK